MATKGIIMLRIGIQIKSFHVSKPTADISNVQKLTNVEENAATVLKGLQKETARP